MQSNLILEETASKRPDAAEDEVQLVPFLGAVMRSVIGRENTLQQVTQHLQVTNVSHRSDLLEARTYRLQAGRNVLVKEYRQIRSFRLRLTRVNPAAYVPTTPALLDAKRLT